MSFARLFFILWLSTSLFAVSMSSAEEVTSVVDTNEVREPFPSNGSVLDQCVWTCNRIAGNHRATSIFKTNCQKLIDQQESLNTLYGQAQNLAKIADLALLKCLPQAGVKAVTGIPEFIMALPSLTYQAASALFSGSESGDSYKKAEACYNSMDCRKGMMRQLIMYRDMNSDGTFKVPDSQMLARMNDVDFNTLWTQSRFQFEASRDECSRILYDVRLEALRGGDGDLTPAIQRQVYNKIAKEKTFCLSVLQLLPPELDPRMQTNPSSAPNTTPAQNKGTDTAALLDRLTLVQKLAVGQACFAEKFDEIVVDFCSDIVSVVVPVPLVGPQSRVVKGAALETEAKGLTTPVRSGQGLLTAAANTAKTSLIDGYKGFVLATKAENSRFIDIATKANQGLLNAARTRFVSVENTAMKFLNSAVPKEFVTALTNFHKQKLDEALDAVKAKYQKLYPGMQIDVYSDFKSVQVAIQSPINISPAMHEQIYADLNAAFGSANKALVDKMAETGLDVAALKQRAAASGMDPRVAADPNMWFRGAIGATPDQTNIAARMARNASSENKLLDFTDPSVRQHAEEAMVAVESQRVALAENLNLQQLMAKNERGLWLPRPEIFDLARKSKSAEDLASAINLRYAGVRGFKPITAAEAESLRHYVKDVNEFNPAIFIAEREVLSLDDAAHGAASADFLGLGSENYWATASGMAGRKDITSGLTAVRREEQLITQGFMQRQARFKEIVKGDVRCSGDDCLKVLGQPMTPQQKGQLMDQLAADPQARRVRVSFIGEGVAQEHRMMLATHGEEIEKSLRANLEGKIPYAKLSQITFGLDMTSSQLNQGFVNLMIGKSGTLRLTAQEQDTILRAFEGAVGKFNQNSSQYLAGSVSANVTGVTLIPGPALIMNSISGEQE